MRVLIDLTYRAARRIVILVAGGTLLLVGIAMIVTPGPAILVIPLGLTVLGLEFAWARHWLRRMRLAISTGAADARAGRADGYRRLRSGDG